MDSINSSFGEAHSTVDNSSTIEQELTDRWLTERFESLLPKIQEKWPDLVKQTLEATKGSLEELINVISQHSGNNSYGVTQQLEELLNSASDKTKDIATNLEPLEKQLEELLDDLNETLRPRIEKPIRNKPLLAIGIAASIGVVLGLLINGGKND